MSWEPKHFTFINQLKQQVLCILLLFMLVIEQHCESLCIPIEVVYNSILPLNRRYSALFGRWGILYGLE